MSLTVARSTNSVENNPVPTTQLRVTKPPTGKVVHDKFGVTKQTDPEVFLSGFNVEYTRHLRDTKLELVPVEQVGLKWVINGVVDEAFTSSGTKQGLRILVSTSLNEK